LLVSWSKLEPRHGSWDTKYIATVQRTVDTAARYGIYSVIDMHQDAWGKYIASPKGVHCTNGGTPAIGWDGAPKWATFTNGTDTCAHGSREMSDAVETAWDSFYANRNGIMDALTETWGVLARQFAEDPAVAGYDLLNEPNHGHDSDTALRALAGYYGNTIRVIREQERAVASPRAAQHHIVFFEDTVFGSVVAPGFTKDTNIVFAPHNYGESIGAIPIEAEFDYYAAAARTSKTAMWIGEYGWFSDPTASAAKVQRFAAKADALLDVGEAWWQWRQACGDPHSIGQPGGKPPSVLIHFQRNACPGDHNLGVVPQWQCTWRPYPLAAPGRLTSLKTGCSNDLEVQGTTAKPGTLEIWFPGHTVPRISGATKGHTTPVPGGFRVSAQVSGTYRVSVAAR
jgi:endoglycosylceramidase